MKPLALLAVVAPLGGAPDAGDDVDALARGIETSLARLGDGLATHACDEACRALGSMKRAADRICQLEVGERCEQARARCEEATRRVREACPECALASKEAPKDQVVAQREPQAGAAKTESVQTEPTRGCASCSTSSGGLLESGTLGGLTALALGALRRRRRGTARR